MRPLRLSSLLLVLALAGCATTVSVPNQQQQAQAQQARQEFQRGQYAQAAQAYLALAAQNHGASDYFRLRAAEAWRENGSLAQAAQALAGVSRARLQAGDAHHYDLLQAEIALSHNDAARALQWTRAPVASLPQPLQARALELRARALAASGKPWDAARTRAQLDPLLADGDLAQNHRHILDLLKSLGVTALQQREKALANDGPMRHWVVTALGHLGVPVARTAPQLTQPVGTLLPGATQGEGYRLPRQVALLLPLSGPLAAAGDTIREGFFASYFQAGSNATDLPPVQVYDSTGTAAGALAGYRQAVAAGATLVVGPLTRDGVDAVLGQASLPVAVLALNHPDDDALPPSNATEFALRPEVEAIQIARRMHERGLTQAVVLVSSEDFAQRAARAFKTQFEGQGGHIVDSLTLSPAQVDYRAQIRSLDLDSSANTGVFLSMRPEQARLLMPQLHLAGVKLPVLATSHVYAGQDNPVADGDLDGIVFCDAPWLFNAQPGLVARAAMAAKLPAARGTSARLFAFGMDAWSLVPYLDWLRAHPGSYLPGASGRLVEDDFGRVRRILTWARFDQGLARPLSGSLELGAPTMQPTPTGATSAPAPALPAAPASTGNDDRY